MATRETRRIEVELDAELAESLDRIAQKLDVPIETVLRDAARQLVAAERPVEDDPLFGIIGMGHSGLRDVSERHDDYLVEDEIAGWKRP